MRDDPIPVCLDKDPHTEKQLRSPCNPSNLDEITSQPSQSKLEVTKMKLQSYYSQIYELAQQLPYDNLFQI